MSYLIDASFADVASRIGWTLLHSLWQCAVVAIVLAVALQALRMHSANSRYVVACAGMVTMLVGFVATFLFLPSLEETGTITVAATVDGQLENLPESALTEPPVRQAVPLASHRVRPGGAVTERPSAEGVQEQDPGAPSEALASTAQPKPGAFVPSLRERAASALAPWISWIAVGWLLGVLSLSIWNIGGWITAQRLRLVGVSPAEPDIAGRFSKLAQRMKVSRPVRLLRSAVVGAPVTIGWLRPTILLPLSLISGLTPSELDAIIIHELAHIRRHDYLVNLLQMVIETLLFYHPALWWVSRQIRIERENCCDDWTVAVTGDSLSYARMLTRFGELRHAGERRLSVGQAVTADGGSLLSRVRRLLPTQRDDHARPRTWMAGGMVLATVALLVLMIGYISLASGISNSPTGDVATWDLGGAKVSSQESKEIEIRVASDMVAEKDATPDAESARESLPLGGDESNVEQSPWGKAVHGVQVRLRADTNTWSAAEVPLLKTDLRNSGQEDWHLIGWMVTQCYARVDDVTYMGGIAAAVGRPGTTVSDVPIKLTGSPQVTDSFRRVPLSTASDEGRLELEPGKHVVCISFRMKRRGAPDEEPSLEVFSNPVTITIEQALPGSRLSVEEAMRRPSAFAIVCEAIDAAERTWVSGIDNRSVVRQQFRVLSVLGDKQAPAGTLSLSYDLLAGPPRHERPIRKGERVIWIGSGRRGWKALSDTPENQSRIDGAESAAALMQKLDTFCLIVQSPASDGMPVPCLSLQVAAGPNTGGRFRPVVEISRDQAERILDRLSADGFFVRARAFDAGGKMAPMSDACTIRIAADASHPKHAFVAGYANKGEAIGQLRGLHTVLEGEAFKAVTKMTAWLELSANSEASGDAVSRYWTEVNHNRDEGLFPPGTLHLLNSRDVTVGPDTKPTHGLATWFSDQRLWLAPPGYEIARIEYRLGDAPPLLAPGVALPTAQIDIASLGDHHAELLSLFEVCVVDIDGTWHELELDPGIRAVTTYVHRTDRWQIKFVLRPWVKPAAVVEDGVLYTRVVPEGADLYVNGESKGRITGGIGSGRIPPGSYEVEARWPDGRRRSVTRDVRQGEYRGVLLNADIAFVSREVVAPSGSLPWLFTDRNGRIWLLWDQASTGVYSTAPRSKSDLFCATSDDGTGWSEPRRLPVSSDNCNMSPVLQQDQHGTYWLMWISDRDPAAPRSLWLASSQDGVQWSPPRKVKLPEATEGEMARWQSSNYPRLAFAMDGQDVFWLAWQGWLIRSDDGSRWKVDSNLPAADKDKADTRPGEPYLQLVSDPSGRLVVLTKQRGFVSPTIWQRSSDAQWQLRGELPQSPSSPFHGASVACSPDGALVGVSASGKGLFLRRFQQAETDAEPVFVEDYGTNPFHPAVAALPGDRLLVVFGSDEGLIATVFEENRTTTASSTNGDELTAGQNEVRQ